MTDRSRDGIETIRRLERWEKDSSAAERFAAGVLALEGFTGIDPSHPRGGPDGKKDLVCARDGKKWVGAIYFPRDRRSLSQIEAKLLTDLEGVARNQADGMVFVCNQDLSLAQREQLTKVAAPHPVDIYHLERIAAILNTPRAFGLRLEFLDLEMTKEEQLAFNSEWIEPLRIIANALKAGATPALGRPGVPFAQVQFLQPSQSVFGVLTLHGQPVRVCKNCQGVFRVAPIDMSSIAYVIGSAVIACPHCGHIEQYRQGFM